PTPGELLGFIVSPVGSCYDGKTTRADRLQPGKADPRLKRVRGMTVVKKMTGLRRGMPRPQLGSLIGAAHHYVAEACRSGPVAGAHGLHGLSFAAVWRAPEVPLVARADGVHGVPELRRDAGVRGVLKHAA